MAETVLQDHLWEYNAPQFVDFSSNPQEDDNADAWFDTVNEDGLIENKEAETNGDICAGLDIIEDADKHLEERPATPQNRRLTRSMANTPVNDKGLPEATESKEKAYPNSKVEKNTSENTATAEEPKKPSNICTDLAAWRTQTTKVLKKPQSNIAKQIPGTKPASRQSPRLEQQSTKTTESSTVANESKKKKSQSNEDTVRGRSATASANESRSRPVRRSHTMRAVSQNNLKKDQSSEDSVQGRSAIIRRSGSLKRSNDSRSVTLKATSCEDLSKVNQSGDSFVRGRSAALRRSQSMKRRSANNNTSLDRNRGSSLERGKKRPHARGYSAGRVLSSERLANLSPNTTDTVPSKMPKLTMPSTPTFMKRKPMQKVNGEKVLSQEEKEMETIAFLRNEMAKKRKMAQESYKKALSGTAVLPVRPKTELTKPHEFEFRTDDRVKSHGMETRHDSKQKDFVKSLRNTNSPPSHVPNDRGHTIPQPFNLTESKKRKLGSMDDLTKSSSFHSMAETITAFHKQTPDRFRSRPRITSEESTFAHAKHNDRRSKSPKGLTVPKTPSFETKTRSRPVTVPSRKDLEEQEIEEMKKNQFKAHPVNQRIMQNPNTGVKKIPSKPLTEPEEFHLTSQRRAQDKEGDSSTDGDKFEFHANPVPKRILEGPVGIKPARHIPATIAKSPAFALKHRARLPVEVPDEQEQKQVRANPVPYSGVPFQPKLGHKSTVPEPFTFEERDRATQAKKEEKIKEFLEEEKKQAREFHAGPYTSPTGSVQLPPKQAKPSTVPKPFSLSVESRGQRKMEEWRQKIDEEAQLQKQQAVFKARPGDVLYKEPFIPQKSCRPLTDVNDFQLNTEKRAVSREQFEMYKKAKESEYEAIRRQREKQQEEEDKISVAKLRAELVHRSQPVKKYKTVQVHPSEKPVTIASTPKFKTDHRLRSKVRV